MNISWLSNSQFKLHKNHSSIMYQNKIFWLSRLLISRFLLSCIFILSFSFFQHTFCRTCVLSRSCEKCPVDDNKLSIVVVNLAVSIKDKIFVIFKYRTIISDILVGKRTCILYIKWKFWLLSSLISPENILLV